MDEREILQRQNLLQEAVSIPENLVIVGMGGIGTYAGIIGALAGVKKIVAFDSDNLEITNLNRLPYPASWIGRPKVDCFEDFIYTIVDAGFRVKIVKFGNYDPDNAFHESEISSANAVFISCDNGAVRKRITDICVKKKIRFVNAGYDGNHVSIYKQFYRSTSSGERTPYIAIPSWSAPTMIAAALGWYQLAYPDIEMNSFSGKIFKIFNSSMYICDECERKFSEKDDFLRHVIVCTKCNQDFHSIGMFNKHLRFECNKCDFVTCKKRALKVHIKKLHPTAESEEPVPVKE